MGVSASWDAIQDVASLRAGAAGLLRGVCGGASSCCVLACVESDIGRAAVTGAFEAAGLLGSERHQLPPHRLGCLLSRLTLAAHQLRCLSHLVLSR